MNFITIPRKSGKDKSVDITLNVEHILAVYAVGDYTMVDLVGDPETLPYQGRIATSLEVEVVNTMIRQAGGRVIDQPVVGPLPLGPR